MEEALVQGCTRTREHSNNRRQNLTSASGASRERRFPNRCFVLRADRVVLPRNDFILLRAVFFCFSQLAARLIKFFLQSVVLRCCFTARI